MLGYVLRRLLLAVSMVWAVSFGAFVAFGLSFDPSYPRNLCTDEACRQQWQQVIDEFHLHDPILRRYWLWLSGLPRHGFGSSVFGRFGGGSGYDIGPDVWHSTWVTAQLLGVALVLVVVASVAVGVVSARLADSPLDWGVRLLAYVAWSIPAFLLGVLLVEGLGSTHWFEIGQRGSGVGGWLRWISLPALALALGLIGLYSRYIRSAMLVSLRQPYAVVARAKGLPEHQVVFGHALRNSLIPFVSVLALDLGAIVGASLAIDWVFSMNGLASLFLHAVGQADPFVMTAILVVIAAVVATFIFLADLLAGWLDPRLRAGAPL
jgi:ABC-type dipeptide/oligopeptide/nickel transport system permease component